MANNEVDEDLQKRYEALEIEDEEEIEITIPNPNTDDQPVEEFHYVGFLYSDREINEVAFKRTISGVWQPRYGVNIKSIAPNTFLFTFFHRYDYEKVWKGSPWNFNNRLLALAPRKLDEDPLQIMITEVPIWLHVIGVPPRYVSMQVCEAIGKFAGTFVEADENNFKVSRPSYLRVRIIIDPRKPLKRKMKLKANEGRQILVEFQYERLPSICLICGSFQHTEVTCPLNYVGSSKPKRMYEPTIRVSNRNNMITEKDKWLRDDKGCSLIPTVLRDKVFGNDENRRVISEAGDRFAALINQDAMETDAVVMDPKRKRLAGQNLASSENGARGSS